MLSRGQAKGAIVKEIAQHLEATGCFEKATKKPDIVIRQPNDQPFLITCILLRPKPIAIVRKAWESIRLAKEKNEGSGAVVRSVAKDGVTVDLYGVLIPVENKLLSELRIEDARKYFRVNDEIIVNVLEYSEETNYALLSNIRSATDPVTLLQEFKEYEGKPVEALVERIIPSESGWETGLTIAFPGKNIRGFIPRYSATYSRFSPLSKTYHQGETLSVEIEAFDARYKTFRCRVSQIKDPWDDMDEYSEGQTVSGIVHQISKRHMLCEIQPGLEAVIPFAEIAWGTEHVKEEALKSQNLGDEVTGTIIAIDLEKRRMTISLKRLTRSPVEKYFGIHSGKIVTGKVRSIKESFALLDLTPEKIEGYLPRTEIMWNFCGDLSNHLKESQELRVKVISHDPVHDNIKVSAKQVRPNSFFEFTASHHVGSAVRGIVTCIENDRSVVVVRFDGDLFVEGYVHKSEISNICYADETLMKVIFSQDREYSFLVKRMDHKFKIVELSRKRLLRQKIEDVKYGQTYNMKITCKISNSWYLHSDILEGFLIYSRSKPVSPGDIVEVIPARISKDDAKVEFSLE